MFWDKKDDKKRLPDLPSSNSDNVPPFEHSILNNTPDLSELPSFPTSPMKKAFPVTPVNRITEDDSRDDLLPQLPEEGTKIKTMEMEEWTPEEKSSILEEPPEQEEASQAPVKFKAPQNKFEKKSSEVFVKIEKFNSARRSLNSIKQKLDDIDVLLKKVRETKLREEQELSSWEKELSAIKSRIQDVNTNIFE